MIQFDNAVKRYGKLILDELKEAGVTCWIAGGAVRDYISHSGKPGEANNLSNTK